MKVAMVIIIGVCLSVNAGAETIVQGRGSYYCADSDGIECFDEIESFAKRAADTDAEGKCAGSATRISAYQIHRKINWGGERATAEATYRCED